MVPLRVLPKPKLDSSCLLRLVRPGVSLTFTVSGKKLHLLVPWAKNGAYAGVLEDSDSLPVHSRTSNSLPELVDFSHFLVDKQFGYLRPIRSIEFQLRTSVQFLCSGVRTSGVSSCWGTPPQKKNNQVVSFWVPFKNQTQNGVPSKTK